MIRSQKRTGLRPFARQLRRLTGWRLLLALLALFGVHESRSSAADLSPVEQLGKQLFFDSNLSSPPGQACASCHAPETGFSGPDSEVNRTTGVYPGAAAGRFGNRKPQTVAYASFSPPRRYDSTDETYVGGQFWDGRAKDLVEQAKGPFLNPLEMNNASAAEVVQKVQQASYRSLFDHVYGVQALQNQNPKMPFDQIAQAIAAYETSSEVNSFSSKYDLSLLGKVQLSAKEKRGLALFAGKANCTACHPHERAADGSPPLFTDFTYDNVGTPRNAANPFYRAAAEANPEGVGYRDLGLGGSLHESAHLGKVKVPTLRNVAKKPHSKFTKSYLHNGGMKTLKEVVHFYNVRDLHPEEFPPPDVTENVNRDELGNLGLTAQDEDDIVAFLETLSDGYVGGSDSIPPRFVEGHPSFRRDRFRGVREVFRVSQYRVGIEQAQRDSEALRR